MIFQFVHVEIFYYIFIDRLLLFLMFLFYFHLLFFLLFLRFLIFLLLLGLLLLGTGIWAYNAFLK